ncbi:MAG TPA: DUF4339 domain-containing protein [Prosthecobacter sp.]|nr:DUF4339 domain-containing protein [Prosthecobacter sp.]
MNAHFYLTKGTKTVGPCTLDDLRNYLAYGSVSGSDLVKRAGEAGWTPLQQLQELTSGGEAPSLEQIASRRRTARYRDYRRVPDQQRCGWVLKHIICGFLFFPPLLWKGAMAIFQGKIFTSAKDESGYLLTWSRRAEVVVSAMLIVNFVTWWWGALWLSDNLQPLLRELLPLFKTGISDLQDWLGRS